MATKTDRYEIVRVKTGWIVRHISSNGVELAKSSQVYKSKRAAQNCQVKMSSTSITTRVIEVDERS